MSDLVFEVEVAAVEVDVEVVEPVVAALLVTGPVGPIGLTGHTGPTGAVGPAGPEGAVGPAGPTGPQGVQGLQGAVGPAGATGATGAKGDTGATGAQGLSLDIQGTVATYGDLPAGSPGDAYIVAADGKLYFRDATGWPANGAGVPFQGPVGATGAQGPAGPAGPTGATGAQGVQGLQGVAGPAGPTGPQGDTGPTGPAGTTSWAGITGVPAGLLTKSVVYVSSSSTFAATANNLYVYLLLSGAMPTLPTAVGNTSVYTVKNTTAAPITLLTTSSQTIDGSTSISIRPLVSVDIVSDGANWWII